MKFTPKENLTLATKSAKALFRDDLHGIYAAREYISIGDTQRIGPDSEYVVP